MITPSPKLKVMVKPAGVILTVGVVAIVATVTFLKPQKASLAALPPETAPIEAFRSHKADTHKKSLFDSREAMVPVSLSDEGKQDWVVWGVSDTQKSVHKKERTVSISDFTLLNPQEKTLGVGKRGPSRGLMWTGGTPIARSGVTYAGVHIEGDNGFQFQVTLHDSAPHTLRVYTGGWKSEGSFVARRPDGTTLPAAGQAIALQEGYYSSVYTVAIPAAKPGEKLTVEWKHKGTGGNISLLAAALK